MSWLLIITIITILAILSLYDLTNEHFGSNYWYGGYYKKYCSSCGNLSGRSCSNCTNCGYCITPNGTGDCVAGDASGPYFRSDCVHYQYNDPYLHYPNSYINPLSFLFRNYYNLRRRQRIGYGGGRRRYPRRDTLEY